MDKKNKICFLTASLGAGYIDGWSRYSLDLISEAVKNNRIEAEALTEMDSTDKNFAGANIKNILPKYERIIKGIFYFLTHYAKFFKAANSCKIAHCLIEPYIPIAYLLFRKKKYYITLHGTYIIAYLKQRKLRWIFKLALKNAETIFCVSRFTADQLKKFIVLDNIKIINNGIDFNYFYREAEPENKTGRFRILTVGAFKYRKGIHLAIAALGKIKEAIPDFEYIIVGDQSEKSYFDLLKEKIKEYHLESNVIFKENLADAELINEYHGSDLFVLTPVSDSGDFEGFGLVYLEANACGLPVIGTFNSGAEEAIRNNYSGLLVEPDPEKIAAAIMKIYNDKELRESLGKNGLAWAKKNDWSIVARKYLESYGLN